MRDVMQGAEGTLVENGRVREGDFRSPFRTPGFERVDLTGLGPLVPLLRARQRFWFGFALTHPDVHLATILIDLGVAVVSAFYVYERGPKAYAEHTAFAFGKKGRVGEQPWDDVSFARARNHRVEYRHRLDARRHDLSLDVAATRTAPAVRAELTMHENPSETPSLVTSVPTDGRWFMYTHKAHAPASGTLRIGDRTYVVDPARDLLSIDEHKAAYPYVQQWSWGSFAGRLADGRLLGANLCANVHYTDPEHRNENRLWVGHRMDALGAIDFRFDPKSPLEPWHIVDSRGAVDLVFTPDGKKHQRTGFGPYRLDYFQAFGRYRGTVADSAGQVHRVDDLVGVAEHGVGRN